ncbi:MAG: hypothetical protein ACQEXJ_24880 [Myxococcota bacterium]
MIAAGTSSPVPGVAVELVTTCRTGSRVRASTVTDASGSYRLECMLSPRADDTSAAFIRVRSDRKLLATSPGHALCDADGQEMTYDFAVEPVRSRDTVGDAPPRTAAAAARPSPSSRRRDDAEQGARGRPRRRWATVRWTAPVEVEEVTLTADRPSRSQQLRLLRAANEQLGGLLGQAGFDADVLGALIEQQDALLCWLESSPRNMQSFMADPLGALLQAPLELDEETRRALRRLVSLSPTTRREADSLPGIAAARVTVSRGRVR